MQSVRPAAVAGMFYPAKQAALRAEVLRCLSEEVQEPAARGGQVRPKLLVVPHAGYVYSGPVAGRAYARLAPMRDRVRRVVLLGPAHRVAVQALASPTVLQFETPMGRVPVDQDALRTLDDLPQVMRDDTAHALEHSLEVQLPFLQSVLGRFELVPLVVGEASPDEVAEVLERLWGGPETLIVVSTDLSHYLPYMQARATDSATVQRLLAGAQDLRPDEACGARALNGALMAARRHGLRPRVLDLRNSGDTAGDRARVVGYLAMVFEGGHTGPGLFEDKDAAPDPGPALLSVAREAIARRLGVTAPPSQDHPWLHEPGTCFVTLHDAAGRLRGCIGGLQAERALGEDVRRHAEAAAFDDPRFPPLTRAEWPGLHLAVSVLEPAVPLPAHDESQACGLLRPGVDGVVLEWRGRRATFLPQVWQQLPHPQDFLAALKRKAGLAPDFWADDVRLSCYAVHKFEEPPS